MQEALEATQTARTARLHLRTEPIGAAAGPVMTMDGVIDLRARRSEVLVRLEEPAPGQAGSTSRQVLDGDTLWIEEPPVGGGRWMEAPAGTGSSDPAGLLDLLRGEVAARRDKEPGPADGFTVWTVSVDTDEAVRRAPATIRPAVRRSLRDARLLGQRLDLEVALGNDGLIRRVRLELGPPAGSDDPAGAGDDRLELVLELSDFGLDAETAVPNAPGRRGPQP